MFVAIFRNRGGCGLHRLCDESGGVAYSALEGLVAASIIGMTNVGAGLRAGPAMYPRVVYSRIAGAANSARFASFGKCSVTLELALMKVLGPKNPGVESDGARYDHLPDRPFHYREDG